MCYKSLPNRVIIKALSRTWSTGSQGGRSAVGAGMEGGRVGKSRETFKVHSH